MNRRKQDKENRYKQIIERIFFANYKEGMTELAFTREDIVRVAREIRIKLPKNIGDVIYSFRPKRLPVGNG
jgi:GTP cyclohydrolase II